MMLGSKSPLSQASLGQIAGQEGCNLLCLQPVKAKGIQHSVALFPGRSLPFPFCNTIFIFESK